MHLPRAPLAHIEQLLLAQPLPTSALLDALTRLQVTGDLPRDARASPAATTCTLVVPRASSSPATIALLDMPPHAVLPLHDHPGAVATRVLRGALHVLRASPACGRRPSPAVPAWQVTLQSFQVAGEGASTSDSGSSFVTPAPTLHAFRAGPAGALVLDVVAGEGGSAWWDVEDGGGSSKKNSATGLGHRGVTPVQYWEALASRLCSGGSDGVTEVRVHPVPPQRSDALLDWVGIEGALDPRIRLE